MDTPVTNHDRYEVSAAEVRDFTEQGFLVVPQLVAPDEVRELRDHTEEVISGDLVIPGRIEPPYRNTDGTLSRTIDIIIPGSDLSQPAMPTRAS